MAAIIPCTNPTSTAIFKALIGLKVGCSVVMSPHHRSAACTRRAVEVCREALAEAGGPADALGAVGATTNLEPSLTLGPGAWGGSATGDNVTATHLINLKRLAWDRDCLPAAGEPVRNEAEIRRVVGRVLDELGY